MRKGLLFLTLLFITAPVCAQVSPWMGSWIWNDSPASAVYFRKMVDIHQDITSAKIAITADNIYTLYINGKVIGSNDDWMNVETYDVKRFLHKGRNIIAVRAEDPSADIGALLIEGSVVSSDGSVKIFGTDNNWRMSIHEKPGWTELKYDDSGWKRPRVIGKPPVGPWGGLDHPELTPKVRLNTVSVDWPKFVKQTNIIKVVCRVRPVSKIQSDTPIALRLSLNGEAVCEHWINPVTPATKWKSGIEQTIVFKAFRLPSYIPSGRYKAQIVTTLTEASGGIDVTVGQVIRQVPPENVQITDLKITLAKSGDSAFRISWKCNQSKDTLFYFTLMKGREMWFAANVTTDHPEVLLPKDFPGGTYEAKLMPHTRICKEAASIKLTLQGPSSTSLKPLGYGTFIDNKGIPHRWHINQAGTLIWDGKPYIPAGGMYISDFFGYRLNSVERNEAALKNDLKRLSELKKVGITDIYLNPCAGWKSRPVWVWQKFIDLCEQMGFRYGIQVTNEVESLKVFDIISDRFNVNIKGGETAYTDIPNTLLTSITPENIVYFAAFDPATGTLLDSGIAKVSEAKNGVRAEARPKVSIGRSITVHFTPEYIQDAGIHNYWNGVNDSFKKDLREFFSTVKPGSNFRLWIDPLDNEQSFTVMGDRFLPNSSGFRKAFTSHLKNKGEIVKSWELSGADKADPALLARLIPIGKASQDSKLAYMLDPDTGKTYPYDPAKSTMWSDMLSFRDNSVADFNYEVAEMIKRHHDAPVVLKHEGSDLFRNRMAYGGFDGLGAEAYGTDLKHIRKTSKAVHDQHKRCGRTMWELTTETGLADSFIGYSDPLNMMTNYISMLEMGGKGTYAFLFLPANASPTSDWYVFNLCSDPRQLHWLGCYARLVKNASPLVDYVPGPEVTAETTEIAPEFLNNTLGLRIIDLGPTFQAVSFNSNTYIWNLTGHDCSLGLDYDVNYADAYVKCPDGRHVKTIKNACTLLPTAANAGCPVVIENAANPVISGVNTANFRAAMSEWRKTNAKIKAAGLQVKDEPESKDWRGVFQETEALRKRTGDIFAPQIASVKIDGNLQEWSNSSPIHLRQMWDVEASKYDGARFYVAYDSNYLYIAGDITDNKVVNNNRPDKLWNGDAAEVFVDLEPDVNPGNPAYTNSCFQFIFAPSSSENKPATAVINPGLPAGSVPKNSLLAVKTSSTGWRFEAAISKTDLNGFEPAPGKVIGFNLQLDNSDGEERVWSKIWHGKDDLFMNRLRFGRLLLGG